MSNVDVAALAGELRPLLVGGRFEKAYQPAKDQVLLRVRRKGVGRLDVLFQLGRYLTVTRRPPDNPDKPSMVATVLRQELANGRVVDVAQVGFDRLLRMDIERGDGRHALVFELFGDGNMLLLDPDGTIRLPMRGAEHGARRLKRGEPYVPPPGSASPFTLDADAFAARGAEAQRDVVRFLALDLGFGPLWAEELCLRADVPKNQAAADTDDDAWQALHAAVAALGAEIAAADLAPVIIHEGDTAIDAVPFQMLRYPAPEFAAEEAPSFRAALDTFFRGTDEDEDVDDPRRARYDEAHGKVQRQVDQMQAAIDGYHEDAARLHQNGEVLYLHFQRVEETLASIRAASDKHSWQAINGILRAARESGDEAAAIVLEVRPDASATLRLADLEGADHDIDVDVRVSVQDNAEAQYAAGKKAKSRAEGAATALAKAKERLADIEAKGLDGFGAAPTKNAGPSRHFWFETYRWAPLPGGFLAVGGRSAAQNDMVVKKYLRDGDRYVHAQIHGAPSVVVRPADGGSDEPDESALLAAGQFAVCASRAWRQFGAASAYWVTAAQVSKTPRSGEFVPKGAWIIHGKRNVLDRLPMEWRIGLMRFTKGGVPCPAGDDAPDLVAKLAGGPPASLAPYSGNSIGVAPGDIEPNEAAVRLAAHFDVPIEQAQAALPGGPVRFLDPVGTPEAD